MKNNERFSLDRHWTLVKGSINIYLLSKTGARTLLAHFTAPQHIFSCPWIGVSEGDGELTPCDTPSAASLNDWVRTLLTHVSMPISEQKSEYIPEHGRAHFSSGVVIQSPYGQKEHLFWVKGPVNFFSFHTSGYFPIFRELWLTTTQETPIEVLTTADLLTQNVWQEALADFHRVLNEYFIHMQKMKEMEEEARIQKKKKKDEENRHQAYYEMAAILNPKITFSPPSQDPLFCACQQIGLKQGLQFVYPPHRTQNEDLLTAICSASNLQYRQVHLNGTWWKEDGGHLLGVRDGKPSALLSNGSGSYHADGQRITEKNVAEFSTVAFMFYVPLPDHIKTGKELMGFFLWRNRKELLSLLIYGSIAALLSLIPPFVTSNLYNSVIPEANLQLLHQLIAVMLTAALSATIFTFFRSLILVRIKGKISNELQMSFWDRIFKLPVLFFRKFNSGNLYFRFFALEDITQLLANSGQRAILSGVFAIFYFIAMIIYAFQLTIWTIFFSLFVLTCSAIASVYKVRLEKQMTELRAKINGVLIQMITGISKLRISNAEASVFSYWAKYFTKKKKLEMEAQHIQNTVIVANAIFPYLSAIILFFIAIELEKKDSLSIFEFLAFNAAFVPFSMALFDLSNIILEMTPIIPLWNNAKVILEEPLEVTTKKGHPGRLKGEIAVDHIHFGYAPNLPILKGVSIHIAPGEFVGIIGPSGCGKSTLLRLLLGFETPLSGEIAYDGHNLDDLNPLDIRKQIGVVLQESNLFSGTLFENIVCGGLFSKKDVERALQLSGFEQDLDSFPMGLHTIITSGGATISGGQRQRLLIARALIGHPKILFFDEATSALDNKTQDTVSRYIDELEVSRFVIAHRLSTLKNADRIYVIDKGLIVQHGTFQGLSSEQGLFKDMLDRQNL